MKKVIRENLVLITIDALRADHLSCLGYKKKTSPNMDNLAKRGILFTQAFSNGSSTPHSFLSILTSTYPLMYGGCRRGTTFFPLSRNRVSISEILKKYGYSTAGFHSNPFLSSYFGYDRGFDTFEDFLFETSDEKISEKLFSHEVFRVPGKMRLIHELLREIVGCMFRHTPYVEARVICQKSLSWLKKNKKGFFLWLHLMEPHYPYFPHQSFIPSTNRWTQSRLNLELNLGRRWVSARNLLTQTGLMQLISLYDSEITYVDHILGHFFDRLKDLAIWLDNTYFIVTADHGEEFMEHGGLAHADKLYEELIHVPLIICGPDVEENVVINNPVSHIDLSPTIVDMLGIKRAHTNFLGKSLFSNSGGETESGVISETGDRKRSCRSYRNSEWKYILTVDEKGVREELYNILRDPAERNNLAEKEKQQCTIFRSKLYEHVLVEEKMAVISEKSRVKAKIETLKKDGRL